MLIWSCNTKEDYIQEVYVNEYVETNDMTSDDKIKDIDMMIDYFEEREKYEDCALLVKIKEKIKKRELLNKIQENE